MEDIQGATIANKITKVFLIGAASLLITYGVLFKLSILATENNSSVQRVALIAPHYFKLHQDTQESKLIIDPLLSIYTDYTLLPEGIRENITQQWTGAESIHYEYDDSEFAVFADKVNGNTFYLVENSNAVEWSDDSFILLEIAISSCGLLLFLIAAYAIKTSANKIAAPFSTLAHELASDSGEDFTKLSSSGTSSYELKQTLTAINSYREKIALAIAREQSFTRYVSHELRTPMTVIKGCVSLLKKQQDIHVDKQCQRINSALDDMQALTQTFLLLARDEQSATQELIINDDFLSEQVADLASYSESNQCNISIQILENVVLEAEATLFKALLKNLLINAINCSPQGHISVFMDNQHLTIIDNGSGLDSKHRGYEGFGIGLIIVKDICQKYHWSFSLANNQDKGCTASVSFN